METKYTAVSAKKQLDRALPARTGLEPFHGVEHCSIKTAIVKGVNGVVLRT